MKFRTELVNDRTFCPKPCASRNHGTSQVLGTKGRRLKMNSLVYKSGTASRSAEIGERNAENSNSVFSASGALELTKSLMPGSLLAPVLHPGHLLCVHAAASEDLLVLRLVFSGVSALCLVAPYAAALIALTLLYLRGMRRKLQRENQHLIWQRIVHAIGRDSRLFVVR